MGELNECGLYLQIHTLSGLVQIILENGIEILKAIEYCKNEYSLNTVILGKQVVLFT